MKSGQKNTELSRAFLRRGNTRLQGERDFLRAATIGFIREEVGHLLLSKGLVAESRLEDAEQGHETQFGAAKLSGNVGSLKPMLAVSLLEVGMDRRLAVAMTPPVQEWEDVDTTVRSTLTRKQFQNFSIKGTVEGPDDLASREIGMLEQNHKNSRHVFVHLLLGEADRLKGEQVVEVVRNELDKFRNGHRAKGRLGK